MPTPTPDDLPREGSCYVDCAETLMEMHDDGWELVHGRPTRTKPPFCEFGHAWLEHAGRGLVLDVAGNKAFRIADYYAVGRIDPAVCRRYSAARARQLLLSHGHYGPWEGVDAVPPVERATKVPAAERLRLDRAAARRAKQAR